MSDEADEDVVYTDMFGIGWTRAEWEAMNDPANLRCEKHDRWEPCRPCLRDKGFYDSPDCADG